MSNDDELLVLGVGLLLLFAGGGGANRARANPDAVDAQLQDLWVAQRKKLRDSNPLTKYDDIIWAKSLSIIGLSTSSGWRDAYRAGMFTPPANLRGFADALMKGPAAAQAYAEAQAQR